MAIKKFNSVYGFSVGEDDVIIDVVDNNANVTANRLVVNSSANLGNVGNITITGGNNGQVLKTDGAGNLFWAQDTATAGGTEGAVQFNDSTSINGSANFLYDKTTSALTLNGNITTNNANLGNLATANYFSGNGVFLSNIAGANVSGIVANANYAAYAGNVTTASQPNITSVGTLSSLTVSGNITSGNANLGDTVTANYFSGNGYLLTGVSAVTATTAGTVTTNSQPNITSVGTLSGLTVSGDTLITGNLTVDGSIANFSLSNVNIQDPIINLSAETTGEPSNNAGIQVVRGLQPNVQFIWNETDKVWQYTPDGTYYYTVTGISNLGNIQLGNVANANYYVGNGVYLSNVAGANVSGQVGNALVAGTVYTNAQPNITSLGTLSSLSVTGNITSSNANLGNLVTANYFSGSGNLLSNIQGANVTGTVSSATVSTTAGTVTTNAQPNITSVGTLASLDVTANITSGNANLGNLVTANYFIGNGIYLSNIAGANVSGIVANANYAAYAGNITLAAQPNITSVGTLTSLAVTSNITAGNADLGNLVTANYFSGNGINLTNIAGANVSGVVANANYAAYAGNITVAAQPNITSLGTLSSLSVTGNISAGNANLGNLISANYFFGSGNLLSNIQGANISGTVANANYAAYAGNVTVADQPNITGVGTLTSLTVTNNVTTGGIKTDNIYYANGQPWDMQQPGGSNTQLQYNSNNNFGASANLTFNDVTNILSIGGNVSAQNANLGNLVTANYVTGTLTTNAQPNITSVGTLSSVTVTGNVSSGNANLGNLVTAGYFSGNGSLLTALTGANVSGIVANANYAAYAGTVTTNAQPNITSVGTLTSLDVTGNITSGNANLGNLVTSNYFSGNGSLLTGLPGSNVTGTVSNANYAAYAGNVTLAAQPNITSVGTLNGLTVSGNTTLTGNLIVDGSVANLSVTDLKIQDNLVELNSELVSGPPIAGSSGIRILRGDDTSVNIRWNETPKAWQYTVDLGSVYTLTGIDSTGNHSLGNLAIANYFSGNGSLLTGLTGANVTGQVANALIAGTVYTNAQPNITSVGTLSGLTSNGVIDFTNASNVTLGAVGNLHISGGTSGYVLSTNGTGGLSWTNPSGVGLAGSNTQVQYNNAGIFGASANFTFNNTSNTLSVDYIVANGVYLSNVAGANVSGQVGNALVAGTVYTNAQPNITSVGTLSSLSVTGNVSSGNANLGNTVTANYFVGNGVYLSNVAGANVSGQVGNALIAGTVYTNTQPNITSLGTLSSLTVSGNITSGNANLGNLVTANYFVGNGIELTNIAGANVSGQVGNALIAGTVYTNAQPNITSVGTLSGLSVNGNATVTGNLIVDGSVANLSVTTLTVQDNVIDISAETIGTPSNNAGLRVIRGDSTNTQLIWNETAKTWQYSGDTGAFFNIVGTDTAGNTQLSNIAIANYFNGNGINLTNIAGANVSGIVANANYAAYAGNVTVAAQPNVTSLGTLSGLTSNGVVNLTNASNVALGTVGNVHISGGTSGYVLSTDGAGALSWVNPSGIGVTGSNTQVQYNNNGAFGASANFTFNNTSNTLTVDKIVANGSQLTNLTGSNVTGQVGNALVAGTVYTNAQPNITSVGTLSDLSVNGNTVIGGNLTVGGTTTYVNVTTFDVKDPIIELGGGTNGAPLTNNDGKDRGTLLHYYTTSPVDAFMGWDNSNAEFGFGSDVTDTNEIIIWNSYANLRGNNFLGTGLIVSGNVTGGNANLGNLVTANYFSGNGINLTNIAGGNVSGIVANANYAAYAGNVTLAAQPNITSLGTLSSLNVVANISSGNADLGNLVTANYFSGNGINLTNIAGANVSGIVANANYAAYAGNVTLAAQPNITSLGTLSGLSVTGNVTSGNISGGNLVSANYFSGNGSLLTGLPGANVVGNVATANYANYAGNVTVAAQPNITSLGTLSSLDVTGNVTSGNATLGNLVIANYFQGNGINLTNIAGANVSGIVGNANYAAYAGNVTVAAQPNITSIGTLTSLTVTGNVTSGNASLGNSVTANYFIGNGIYLSNIAGANVSGVVSDATYAIYTDNVTGPEQPNITAVGTLISLSVTGNVTAGNADLGNLVTANYFSGNGINLTNIAGGNVSGIVANANYAAYAGNITVAAQPNITSLGTLTSLAVTGNVTSGNATLGNLVTANYFSGNGINLTNIAGGNVSGIVANANYAGYAGNVTLAAQPNITSVGTLSGLTSNGIIDFTNTSNVTLGDVSNLHISGGTSGYVLQTNGSGSLTWVNPSGIGVSGSNTQIQYNNNNAFGASANFTFNNTSNTLYVDNTVLTNNLTVGGNITTGSANKNQLINLSPNILEIRGGWNDANGLLSLFSGDYANGGPFAKLSLVANANAISSEADTFTFYNKPNNATLLKVSNSTISTNTTTGAIQVSGGAGITGNLHVGGVGNFAGNVSGLNANLGNLVTANYFTGDGYLLSNITGANVSGTVSNSNYAAYAGNVTGAAQPNITSLGTLTSLDVTGNVTSGNATLGNLVTANYFSGNGINITNIAGANVSGVVGNANYSAYAGNVTIAAQPNITSVGTLSSLTVTSNVTAGNVAGGNLVSANFVSGDGYLLSNITGANVSGIVANANNAAYAGNVTVAAQPNITSVGTLTSLTVTGNVTSGNVSGGNLVSANYISGNGTYLSALTGANVTGQVGNALIAGTVYTNAQPNITSVGTLTSLDVTGNVTSGNATLGNLVTANYFSGNGSLLTGLPGANVVGNVATANYANYAGNVVNASQPNITTVGTLSGVAVSGDATITGNLTVTGTTTYVNVTTFNVKDPVIELGGGSNGNGLTNNDGKDRGTLLHYYTTGPVDAFMGWDNSNAEFGFGSDVVNVNEVMVWNSYGNVRANNFLGTGLIVSGNVTGGNASLGNLVTANYFTGNGINLTNIAGANVSGIVANANYAAYAGNITVAAQPNITSLGTLTSLTVTSNISAGNANLGNLVTAGYFSGNGALLSALTGANVTGIVSNANYAAYAGNVTLAAQPNITSLGTLTGITSTGTIDFGNTVNVTLGGVSNLHISGGTNGYVLSTNGSGVLSWTNPSGVGLAGLNTQVQYNNNGAFGASANFTFNNISNTLTVDNIVANGVGLTSLTGANVTGIVASANIAAYAGNVTIAAQPNITSLGTLSGVTLASNGNIAMTGAASQLSGANLVSANYVTGTLTTQAQPNITSVGTLSGITLAANGNISMTGTLSQLSGGNLVSAAYISGDGHLLSNITGANVTGTVANANNSAYAGNVTVAAQPNITSLGTLSSLSVTGNVTSGNISGGNLVTANYFIGNGSLLTGIPGANVSGNVATANYANYAGNVVNASQPNITSLGTLSSVSVSGDATISGNLTVSGTTTYINVTSFDIKDPIISLGGSGNGAGPTSDDGKDRGTLLQYYRSGPGPINAFMGWDNSNAEFGFGSNVFLVNEVVLWNDYSNVRANNYIGTGVIVTGNVTSGNANLGNLVTANYFTGNGSLLTSITGANVTGTVANANNAAYAGNVTVAAQPNITSLGTLSSVSVTGNVSAGNANLGNLVTANYFTGNGSLLTALTGANVTGTVANANYAAYAGNVTLAAQANITSLGTLSGLTSEGTVNFTNSTNVTLGPVSTVHITGGTSGQILSTDGTGTLSWLNPASLGLAGFNTQVQFNNSGSFGASANFTYNNTTKTLTVDKIVANAAGLTYIPAANIVGAIPLANVAYTVSNAAQPNITSLGTLSGLTVTGTTDLGAPTNLVISGGASGYVLTTDGAGHLSWSAAPSGGNTGVLGFLGIFKDRFTANGSGNTYTLSTTPASQTYIEVIIDGLQQVSNTYSLSGNVLSFPTNPSSGQVIEVTTYTTQNVAGNTTEVQFNNSGLFAASSSFTYNTSTNTLTTGNLVTSSNATVSGGYITVGSGVIGVAAGAAGIFTTGITDVNIGLAGNVVLGSATGNITSRGNLIANTNLTVSNTATITNLKVNDLYSNRTPVSVTTGTVIDSFSVNKYRSAKYTMRVNSSTGYQAVEVLLVHDGSDAFVTIYGSISTTGSDIITLSAGISSGNVELYASTVASSVTVNLLGTYVAD